MARNQELIPVAETYVEITSGSATQALVQVQGGAVFLRVSLPGEPAPTASQPGLLLRNPDGEWQMVLEDFFHVFGARRLWARRSGSVPASVFVSHADA